MSWLGMWFLVSALSGCGAHVGGLCGEAAACDYIDADDEAECRKDIHDALAEGDLEKQDVDECLVCMRDNDCNLDTFVDCNTECAKVSPYVFGARVH
ncbi:MAG TPA: hypothetical protein VN764_11845 [Polyangiaceae bacterium]|nr:hypothetical protein [Polyangiaceae bacterium]